MLRADPTQRRTASRAPTAARLPGATALLPRAVLRHLAAPWPPRSASRRSASRRRFQSRLGRTPWIRPYTDICSPELAGRGVRRLAVLCPSFVADCLETLEEIGMRAREHWVTELRGEALALAPCLNASAPFVEFMAEQVRTAAR